LFELLEGYRNKGEQMGMAEPDIPAPAPPPAKKKVVIKVPKKKVVKKTPATDMERAMEALTNPAVGVMTNPDLVRLIGSFTKGMAKPYTAVKGIRGKLRDDLLAFFKPLYQNKSYKLYRGKNEPNTDNINDGQISFDGRDGLEWKDIVDIVKKITLQTDKYSQYQISRQDNERRLISKLLYNNDGKKTIRIEDMVIPIPKFKDSKFRFEEMPDFNA